MKLMLSTFVVAAVAFLCFQVGVFERPPFVYQDAFLNGMELLAVVAATKERNIGKHVGRLVEGTQKGVESLENGDVKLKAAAKAYGLDNSIPSLSVGLYFDDPSTTENPRWAIGWGVEGHTLEELRALLPEIQKTSGLSEDIKVVRIGGAGTKSFTARIPWRNVFTPMIAPMLHWRRGFQILKEFLEANEDADNKVPPIALEVYVCGENDAKEFIDYTVLFGDVAKTVNDCFPESPEEMDEQSTLDGTLEREELAEESVQKEEDSPVDGAEEEVKSATESVEEAVDVASE